MNSDKIWCSSGDRKFLLSASKIYKSFWPETRHLFVPHTWEYDDWHYANTHNGETNTAVFPNGHIMSGCNYNTCTNREPWCLKDVHEPCRLRKQRWISRGSTHHETPQISYMFTQRLDVQFNHLYRSNYWEQCNVILVKIASPKNTLSKILDPPRVCA
jgi:hypothetical protein